MSSSTIFVETNLGTLQLGQSNSHIGDSLLPKLVKFGYVFCPSIYFALKELVSNLKKKKKYLFENIRKF